MREVVRLKHRCGEHGAMDRQGKVCMRQEQDMRPEPWGAAVL